MNSEIEKLIELALADGVVTEKERATILRKAESLGVDKDEVEMTLDAKLHLKQNEVAPKPKSQKEGEIIKCPSCGDVLDSFSSKCPSCDHEIRGKGANKIILNIESKIESVQADFNERIAKTSNKRDLDYMESRDEAIALVISNIPVPSTKEDLLEVIAFCYPKVTGIVHTEAYSAKFNECLAKLEMLIVNNFKEKVAEEKKAQWRIVKNMLLVFLVITIIVFVFMFFFSSDDVKSLDQKMKNKVENYVGEKLNDN